MEQTVQYQHLAPSDESSDMDQHRKEQPINSNDNVCTCNVPFGYVTIACVMRGLIVAYLLTRWPIMDGTVSMLFVRVGAGRCGRGSK